MRAVIGPKGAEGRRSELRKPLWHKDSTALTFPHEGCHMMAHAGAVERRWRAGAGRPRVRHRNREIARAEPELVWATISSRSWSTRVEPAEQICESWQ